MNEVAETTQTLQETINSLVLDIKALVEEHGQDGIELVGFILQLEAAFLILWPLLFIILFILSLKLIRYTNTLKSESFMDDGPFFKRSLSYIFSFILVAVSIIGLLDGTLRPMLWVAMFDPYTAIAVKALGYF